MHHIIAFNWGFRPKSLLPAIGTVMVLFCVFVCVCVILQLCEMRKAGGILNTKSADLAVCVFCVHPLSTVFEHMETWSVIILVVWLIKRNGCAVQGRAPSPDNLCTQILSIWCDKPHKFAGPNSSPLAAFVVCGTPLITLGMSH